MGRGELAARLLHDHLPIDARYVGLDISSTMVSLAQGRLKPWSERARVDQSDGSPRIAFRAEAAVTYSKKSARSTQSFIPGKMYRAALAAILSCPYAPKVYTPEVQSENDFAIVFIGSKSFRLSSGSWMKPYFR